VITSGTHRQLPGCNPDLIRNKAICGIVGTCRQPAVPGLWPQHSAIADGAVSRLTGALCNPVRPCSPCGRHALVREGVRNLVVTLRKPESVFRKISPVGETGCVWPAPPWRSTCYFNYYFNLGSVHKPAHADIHYDPQCQEHEQHRRSPVTH
jgi:hypothetical protein